MAARSPPSTPAAEKVHEKTAAPPLAFKKHRARGGEEAERRRNENGTPAVCGEEEEEKDKDCFIRALQKWHQKDIYRWQLTSSDGLK